MKQVNKIELDIPVDDEENLKFCHINVEFVIEHVLSEWTVIKWEKDETANQRVIHYPKLKNRFIARKPEAVDSLQTLRTYYYIPPNHFQVVVIPKEFTTDPAVAKKSRLLLKKRGWTTDDIKIVEMGIPTVIEEHKRAYDYAVSLLEEDERENEHILDILREKHLDCPCFPMCKTSENVPDINVVASSKVEGSTFYALCTSSPQGMSDQELATYLDHFVNYMKSRMVKQGNIVEILPETCVYYDYMTVECSADSQLYLFINIRPRLATLK